MSGPRNRKSKAGGWVTMVVLLALGGLSIRFNPFALEKLSSAKEATRVTMRRMTAALERYRTFAGCYPSAEQGLQVFVAQPANGPLPERWEQMFLEVPRDGWNRELRYELDSSSEFAKPLLTSAGADGKFGTRDDIASRARGEIRGSETANILSENSFIRMRSNFPDVALAPTPTSAIGVKMDPIDVRGESWSKGPCALCIERRGPISRKILLFRAMEADRRCMHRASRRRFFPTNWGQVFGRKAFVSL